MILRVPTVGTLGLFALACVAILVVPGPAVLYVVTRSLENGRRVGFAAVAGIHLGTVVHVVAAAAGLSALLVASADAFAVVKYAGAAYLLALGVRRLARPTAIDPSAAAPARTTRQALVHGVVVNVLNPKTALFFLAFLPPFLAPGRGPVYAQVLVLGGVFIGLGLLTDGAYALAAAAVATRWGRRGRPSGRAGQRVTGLVYLALAAVAALTPRHTAPRA
jgi:threonine/homoserine/homoserine lactone efflux protein